MNGIENDPTVVRGWWRRNRAWLPAAAVLGVLAFYLPWRITERELDRGQPRNAIHAATGADAWSEYAGARWRITGVQREAAPAGTAANYQHPDAQRLTIDFEVLPGIGIDAQRLAQCKGRLVDAQGRTWEANMPVRLWTWMRRRGLDGSCGSNASDAQATALAGQPLAFTHVYLVPTDLPLQGLQADLFFPPFTTTPKMGTYLRFTLPTPRP